MTSLSIDQYRKLTGQQAKPSAKAKKESKYKNHHVEIDGFKFDSKKEAKRYQDLKILIKAGEISDLCMQVSYELVPAVKYDSQKRKTPAMRYVADFVYLDAKTGLLVVEDVKSAVTRKLRPYRMKKHLMMSVHGIEIQEV